MICGGHHSVMVMWRSVYATNNSIIPVVIAAIVCNICQLHYFQLAAEFVANCSVYGSSWLFVVFAAICKLMELHHCDCFIMHYFDLELVFS